MFASCFTNAAHSDEREYQPLEYFGRQGSIRLGDRVRMETTQNGPIGMVASMADLAEDAEDAEVQPQLRRLPQCRFERILDRRPCALRRTIPINGHALLLSRLSAHRGSYEPASPTLCNFNLDTPHHLPCLGPPLLLAFVSMTDILMYPEFVGEASHLAEVRSITVATVRAVLTKRQSDSSDSTHLIRMSLNGLLRPQR